MEDIEYFVCGWCAQVPLREYWSIIFLLFYFSFKETLSRRLLFSMLQIYALTHFLVENWQ